MSVLYFLSFSDVLKNIGNVIINILIFVLVLGVIVGIHEAGHMLFAKRGGILCREYAIGMGPKLCGKKIGETEFNLRAIPIGGFCAIAGEELEEDPFKKMEKIKLEIVDGVIKGFYLDVDEPEDSKYYRNFPVYKIVSYDIFDAEQTGNLYMDVEENGETVHYPVDPQAILYQKRISMQIAPYNRTLASKSKRRRAMVMFGGPLMNFVLSIIAFLIVGLCTGFPNYNSSELGEVSEELTVGEFLEKGDVITKMSTNGLGDQEINSWNDVQDYMARYDENYLAEPITIYFNHNGEEKSGVAIPFIAINNAGFGSSLDYPTKGVIVEAYQEIKDLGNNQELKVGDEIISIWTEGEEKINNPTWSDVRKVFSNIAGENKEDDKYNYVYMTVRRTVDEEVKEVEIKVKPYSQYLMKNQTTLNGSAVATTTATMGISPTTKFSLIKSVAYSFTRTWDSFVSVVGTFKLLFKGSVSIKNLSGPIGIFSITSQARKNGVLYLISLVGLLSVNIGMLNLLPIPALDGGRLLFIGYEAITKKKPSQKVETILITVTMLLLFALMIFVAFEDIMRLIG